MNKTLFIRFFDRQDSQIPDESCHIGEKRHLSSHDLDRFNANYQIVEWMEKHPNGKVDFIWI